MPRVIRRTPLENYVKDYLKSTNTRKRANTDLLLKATEYINQKIAANCCDPENPVINLHTGKDSTFVHTVYTILQGMSRVGHIQSLTRTRDAIIDYVINPCCFADDTTFDITGPEGDISTITDPYSLVATATVRGPYVSYITHIDFYINAVLSDVSLLNPSSVAVDVDNPGGATPYTYYWIAYTENGTSVQSASTSFILNNP